MTILFMSVIQQIFWLQVKGIKSRKYTSIHQVPNDSFFSIDEELGEIRTRTALDFETQNVHYLTVVARDKGEKNQLSSSSTFTVFVQDTADEVPTFPTRLYTATIPENTEDAYVTTVQVCFQ